MLDFTKIKKKPTNPQNRNIQGSKEYESYQARKVECYTEIIIWKFTEGYRSLFFKIPLTACCIAVIFWEVNFSVSGGDN